MSNNYNNGLNKNSQTRTWMTLEKAEKLIKGKLAKLYKEHGWT